jgi:hypothetical protein
VLQALLRPRGPQVTSKFDRLGENGFSARLAQSATAASMRRRSHQTAAGEEDEARALAALNASLRPIHAVLASTRCSAANFTRCAFVQDHVNGQDALGHNGWPLGK